MEKYLFKMATCGVRHIATSQARTAIKSHGVGNDLPSQMKQSHNKTKEYTEIRSDTINPEFCRTAYNKISSVRIAVSSMVKPAYKPGQNRVQPWSHTIGMTNCANKNIQEIKKNAHEQFNSNSIKKLDLTREAGLEAYNEQRKKSKKYDKFDSKKEAEMFLCNKPVNQSKSEAVLRTRSAIKDVLNVRETEPKVSDPNNQSQANSVTNHKIERKLAADFW